MEDDKTPMLGPEMLTPTQVRALTVFGFRDARVQVGEILIMPRHQALYAAFLQLVTLDVNGEAMNNQIKM